MEFIKLCPSLITAVKCPISAGDVAIDTVLPDIADIRQDRKGQSLYDSIYEGLHPGCGRERYLPMSTLYDETGLKIYEKITYLEEYYPTKAEIEILEDNAEQIARALQPGSIVLELGSGNLRKANILLSALDHLGKHTDYYALDLSLPDLARTIPPESSSFPPKFTHIRCHGLWGTYDDGLEWLKRPELHNKPKTILWLGLSVGNFRRKDAARFLKAFVDVLRPGDSIILGVDACKDPERVCNAYNDRGGITHGFYANGLVNANRIVGKSVFEVEDWRVEGGYDGERSCHEAFLTAVRETKVWGAVVPKGERIRLEEAYKYGEEETFELWEGCGAREVCRWANGLGDYALYMITPNKFGPLL